MGVWGPVLVRLGLNCLCHWAGLEPTTSYKAELLMLLLWFLWCRSGHLGNNRLPTTTSPNHTNTQKLRNIFATYLVQDLHTKKCTFCRIIPIMAKFCGVFWENSQKKNRIFVNKYCWHICNHNIACAEELQTVE